MRRFLTNPTVRGLAIVAAVSALIVALSLEEALLTARALLSIAFFLAIALFLFLVWRERRGDIEVWPLSARIAFYGAVALAVATVGLLLTLDPTGPESATGLIVLGLCAFAAIRVWRDQRRLA